ncbi:flagellar biosynthetic protein FliR, partial [bacterium]|nr:flagellar biosynthetic protein FliR [bacterium]
ARLVPQMNVFIVGFPLKIGLGLFGLTLTVPVVVYIISKFFLWFESELTKIMILLGGG